MRFFFVDCLLVRASLVVRMLVLYQPVECSYVGATACPRGCVCRYVLNPSFGLQR